MGPTSPSPMLLSDDQRRAVDRLAGLVVRSGLSVPAIFFLESIRPLSFIGSQGMVMLSPTVGALFTFPEWDALAALLEDRRGIEVVLQRIEALAAEAN